MKIIQRESYFDGGMLGLIWISFLKEFISLITLTIAWPWMACMKKRWYAKHTIINGWRLSFDGRGHQYLGMRLKWFFFVIITLGIYGLWLPVKYKKWVAKHTHYKAEKTTADQVVNYNGAYNVATGYTVGEQLQSQGGNRLAGVVCVQKRAEDGKWQQKDVYRYVNKPYAELPQARRIGEQSSDKARAALPQARKNEDTENDKA